jgi:hypothetical protein
LTTNNKGNKSLIEVYVKGFFYMVNERVYMDSLTRQIRGKTGELVSYGRRWK